MIFLIFKKLIYKLKQCFYLAPKLLKVKVTQEKEIQQEQSQPHIESIKAVPIEEGRK